MNKLFSLVLMSFVLYSCENKIETKKIDSVNWDKRAVSFALNDSLVKGSTYLSVYSEIYNFTESEKRTLTATVSMRNVDKKDSIYVFKADYYNTNGKLIRTYFDKPIYLAPMETVEIIISQTDKEGGTGGNFLFDWKTKAGVGEPIFEAVMISISGQHGLSFTTQGKRVD